MRKNNKKALFLLCLFLLLGPYNSVLALEINYPKVPGALAPQDFVGIAPSEQIISLYALYIFNLTIWLGGVIALGILIYAGFLYLTSAGKPEGMTRAREQIASVFFGILLLLSSYIILQILNPQLVIFETPKFEPIKTIERPEVPEPPAELHRSAIGAEVPWANIIEDRIFATSTMREVKENASTTLAIAKRLEELSEDLKSNVDQCRCSQTESICSPCVTKPPSTSDTCESVRADIERLQQDEILPKLEELKAERQKTVELVRLLKKESGKLERAEQFMIDCHLTPLESLAEFLNTKNYYQSNKWLFLNIKFWEQILTVEDWANFYCPVSGTIWGGEQYTPPPEEATSTELVEQALEPLACLTEVPVGDIIDRTKRTTKLLIERLEKLIDLQGALIEAVATMQVSVSECSSRRCTSVCIRTRRGCIKLPPVGTPCPYGDISQWLNTIQEIVAEIERTVTEEDKEDIGIIPIIEIIVPKILEDLEKEVRLNMKLCVTEISPESAEEQPAVILSNCESALRAVGPKGVIIENCCLEEPQFRECQDECYLEESQGKYKTCLGECLRDKAEELRAEGKIRESEIIATCRNRINFYCCGR